MADEHKLNTKQKDGFQYDYYEIYCEPTEIDWSDPDFDWGDFDFSNDNFSLMLRVKKGQEKPTEQEVEDFLGDDYLLIDDGNGNSKRYHVIGVWESERDDGGEVFDLDDFEYDDIITFPEVLTASLKKEDLDLQPMDYSADVEKQSDGSYKINGNGLKADILNVIDNGDTDTVKSALNNYMDDEHPWVFSLMQDGTKDANGEWDPAPVFQVGVLNANSGELVKLPGCSFDDEKLVDGYAVYVWSDPMLDLFGYEYVEEYFDLDEAKQEVKEDLDLVPADYEGIDEKAEALMDYLEEYEDIVSVIVREYPDTDYGWRSNLYEDLDENSEWLICSYSEAQEYVEDRIRDYIGDVGPIEAYGLDMVEDYLDEARFDDMMDDEIRYSVDDLDYDELAERLEDAGIIGEEDKVQDPDWEADPDEPDEEPEMIYTEDFLDSKREDLIDYEKDSYSDGIDYYLSMFGREELKELIRYDDSYIDIDRLVEDLAANADFGAELDIDGNEIELKIETEGGRTYEAYAYKLN